MICGICTGIAEWVLPPNVQGPYSCKVAAECGLEGVQLDLGEYERGFPLTNEYIQNAYKESSEKYGVQFPSLAVVALIKYGMTNKRYTRKGRIASLAIQKGIETAYAMGINILMLPSFFDGAINSEEDFQTTADYLRSACDEAKGTDIIIATENILDPADNLRLLNVVGRENIKIYFDTQNPYGYRGQNVYKQIPILNCNIIQTHVKDGGVNAIGSALLGTGGAEFYKSMEEFKKIGYQGWMVLENNYDQKPLSDINNDPFALIKKDVAILNNAIKEIIC